jgi:hypothetical protein
MGDSTVFDPPAFRAPHNKRQVVNFTLARRTPARGAPSPEGLDFSTFGA